MSIQNDFIQRGLENSSAEYRGKGPSLDDFGEDFIYETQAIGYQGQRRKLRKEVESSTASIELLEFFTKKMTYIQTHRGFLWKIKKENAKNESKPVYLFGVSHFTTVQYAPASKFFHSKVLKVFKRCKNLYTELDLPSLSEEQKQPIEIALNTEVNSENRQIALSKPIEKVFKEFVEDSLGQDTALMALAPGNSISIHSLETVEIQAKFFHSLADINQKELPNYPGEIFLDIIDAIQSGNLDQLNETFNDMSDSFKKLIEERNIRIAEVISETLEKGEEAMFSVGAFHVLGQQGILNLLTKYKITRINLD